ncbi:MAG: hypothetical protein ACPGNV_18110 [Mangrovicoccus sp.]
MVTKPGQDGIYTPPGRISDAALAAELRKIAQATARLADRLAALEAAQNVE